MLLALTPNLVSMYGIYALFTFGAAGISIIPLSVLLASWFVRMRGRAIGIAYTGVGFGQLAITPIARKCSTTSGLSVNSEPPLMIRSAVPERIIIAAVPSA